MFEVTNILQELFDQPGWTAGNGVLFQLTQPNNSSAIGIDFYNVDYNNGSNTPLLVVLDTNSVDQWLAEYKIYAINMKVGFYQSLNPTIKASGGAVVGGTAIVG